MNNMLWYRSWLDTRWRFLIGLVLLTISTSGTVLFYPEVVEMLPLAGSMEFQGVIAQRLAEGIALSGTFAGYVWFETFGQNLTQMGVLFAALLGVVGPLFQNQGQGVLFMLSLPASRQRLFFTRIAAGLLELFVLSLIPALFISLLAPAIDEQFPVTAALVHGFSLFIVGSVFFSATILLSTILDDTWRPLLTVCGVAMVLALFANPLGSLNIFAIMTGESYFRTGGLPWLGFAVCIVLSVGLLGRAMQVFSRRDF